MNKNFVLFDYPQVCAYDDLFAILLFGNCFTIIWITIIDIQIAHPFGPVKLIYVHKDILSAIKDLALGNNNTFGLAW